MPSEHYLDVLWAKHEAMEKLMDERRECDQMALELQAEMNKLQFQILNNESKNTRWYIAIGVGIVLAAQFFLKQ